MRYEGIHPLIHFGERRDAYILTMQRLPPVEFGKCPLRIRPPLNKIHCTL